MESALLATKDDDSLKALGFILEAWEEGTESGVAPELMAYAALYTALRQGAALGLTVVSRFTYTLESLIQAGKSLVAVDHVVVGTNEKMRESREKMMSASPEDRQAYAKKIFERVESEDKEGRGR